MFHRHDHVMFAFSGIWKYIGLSIKILTCDISNIV